MLVTTTLTGPSIGKPTTYENYAFFGGVPVVKRINHDQAGSVRPEDWTPFGQHLWWWLPPTATGAASGITAGAATLNGTVFQQRREHDRHLRVRAGDGLRPGRRRGAEPACAGGVRCALRHQIMQGLHVLRTASFLIDAACRSGQGHIEEPAAIAFVSRIFPSAIVHPQRDGGLVYCGITPLCPTGPSLLGEARAVNRGNPRHLFGDVQELAPAHEKRNRAYVLSDGTILAWGKRVGGGDLTGLGVVGGNGHNDLWKARQIYQAQA